MENAHGNRGRIDCQQTVQMGEEEQFDKAVKYVNGTMKESGVRLSDEQKLRLYQK
jgi:hypothetical protein